MAVLGITVLLVWFSKSWKQELSDAAIVLEQKLKVRSPASVAAIPQESPAMQHAISSSFRGSAILQQSGMAIVLGHRITMPGLTGPRVLLMSCPRLPKLPAEPRSMLTQTCCPTFSAIIIMTHPQTQMLDPDP